MKNFSLKITVLLGCLWLASTPSLADQFTHKGFYIGLGVNAGDINIRRKEAGCDHSDCIHRENVGFNASLSPRIGYQFDESRLEYMWMSFDYRYQSQPFHASWHLINFEYNIFRGIVVGIGSGLVESKHGGFAFRGHIGYTHPINQNVNGSIYYFTQSALPFFLSSLFNSEEINVSKAGLEFIISYHF